MRINKFLYFGDFLVIPVALVVFFSLAGHAAGVAAAGPYGAGMVGGVVAWTLAEYGIHRWIYHHLPVLSDYHERHHAEPNALIGMPSFLSSGLVAALAYGPIFQVAPVVADGFASGALIGYAGYMFVHHATHHWPIAPGSWLYGAKLRHMAHHHRGDCNFGIVTGFWDRLFETAGGKARRGASPTTLPRVRIRDSRNRPYMGPNQ